jgi:hypothetical protein
VLAVFRRISNSFNGCATITLPSLQGARSISTASILTATGFPNAYRSVGVVLNFVDHANPTLGRELHKQYDVVSLFESDKYAKLTPAEKDSLTAKIQDLIALMRRERVELAAATSVDEYEWALRESLNAAQDDVFMRSLPSELSDGSPAIRLQSDLRDLAMADNLMWATTGEFPRQDFFLCARWACVGQSEALPFSNSAGLERRLQVHRHVPALSARPRHGCYGQLVRTRCRSSCLDVATGYLGPGRTAKLAFHSRVCDGSSRSARR